MKTVIGFNGSPRVTGNTSRLVQAILAGAQAAGAKTRLVHLARLDMGGCTACMACRQQAACSQPDDMGRVVQDILHADAVVLGSPVYMWQVSGQTKMFMDRLYPLLNPDFSTRLVRRPRLALAFTQGHPDESFFWPYFEQTSKVLSLLGFTSIEIVSATGTRAPDDVEKQVATLVRAREVGAGLV